MDDLRLYEALRWEPRQGYFLLDAHLARLARSALHFGFPVDARDARARLLAFADALDARPRKVRLELARSGELLVEAQDLKSSAPVRAALAAHPVQRDDPLLRHKTSRREVYERALEGRPDVEDVVLWNECEELTETSCANLVLEIAGRKLTPLESSGLLPGTFREHLLARGEIEEASLGVDSLARANAVFGINSARLWFPLELA